MLGVVTFKWGTKFTAEHVNVARKMIARNYAAPHRFFCVTDDARGIDPEVEIVPLWDDFGTMVSPHGASYPSCYRRLRIFAPEAADIFGPRFVALDLDFVATGDLSPLWDRPEDFVIWGRTNPTTHYNASMILMTAGARRQVWDDFDPDTSPALAQRHQQFGSDQGWISYRLGPGEPMWTQADGLWSWRNSIFPRGCRLPAGARMVMFHGKRHNPWDHLPMRLNWVRENWR